MTLHFAKMNGAGNDFVVIDNRDGERSLDRGAIARLCDRHRGVGADGLLAVEQAVKGADFRMRYYNADGGEAEMCGNGARCFARFADRLLASGRDTVSFETVAGVISAQLFGERVRLQMSPPHALALPAALEVEGEKLTVHSVNTGVPHAVVFCDEVKQLNVQKLGAALRWHEHFAPKGTNVNFVQRQRDGTLALRTYERGVEDETLACGTGVVAAALLAHRLHALPSPISVRARGGDLLEVGFVVAGEVFAEVTLTGPAEFVFEGEIAL